VLRTTYILYRAMLLQVIRQYVPWYSYELIVTCTIRAVPVRGPLWLRS